MLQFIEKVLPHWQTSDRGYRFVQGMQAFALEESGHYQRAERCGRNAVESSGDDQWTAHAVAHVKQIQGRYSEGLHWLNSLLPNWHNSGNFIFHRHWHQALFHRGLGNPIKPSSSMTGNCKPLLATTSTWMFAMQHRCCRA
jgi:hypothetical protein